MSLSSTMLETNKESEGIELRRFTSDRAVYRVTKLVCPEPRGIEYIVLVDEMENIFKPGRFRGDLERKCFSDYAEAVRFYFKAQNHYK